LREGGRYDQVVESQIGRAEDLEVRAIDRHGTIGERVRFAGGA